MVPGTSDSRHDRGGKREAKKKKKKTRDGRSSGRFGTDAAVGVKKRRREEEGERSRREGYTSTKYARRDGDDDGGGDGGDGRGWPEKPRRQQETGWLGCVEQRWENKRSSFLERGGDLQALKITLGLPVAASSLWHIHTHIQETSINSSRRVLRCLFWCFCPRPASVPLGCARSFVVWICRWMYGATKVRRREQLTRHPLSTSRQTYGAMQTSSST